MSNFNKVILVGNLARDPELRYTASGSAVCEFALAVNSKSKDKTTGLYVDEVSFIDCVAWGKTAEICSEYLKKGRSALVEGKLKQERWEDKQTGQKRSKVKVSVDNVQFLGGGRENAQGGEAPGQKEATSSPAPGAESEPGF